MIKNKMLKIKMILVFYFTINCTKGGFIGQRNSCKDDSECRAGRECRHAGGGRLRCECRVSCPETWKPVCGSDGVSYDNHCYLHKAACDSSRHISPVHGGFCSGDREAVIARQEFIQQLSLWDEEIPEEQSSRKVPMPDACFENDRNRLREFLVSWLSLSAKKQPWYTPGMTAGEELWGQFYTGDRDRDLAWDTREWIQHLNNTERRKSDKMRQLCIFELVEEGDSDGDGKINFDEFRTLLSPHYKPSSKVCDLDGIRFSDGAERALECNGCVCACGKWICTSQKCSEGFRNKEMDDGEWDDDDEDPEDDPDVQDINWF